MHRITLLSLVALTGCLKSHNVQLAPIPQVVINNVDIRDTLFAERSTAYTVLAFRRADLPNKSTLDSAAAEFERVRGEKPSPVTLYVGVGKPNGDSMPIALDTVDVAVYGAPAGLVHPMFVSGYLFDAWDRAAAAAGPGRK